jgi:DNA-binding transcriptional regulator GbsR (MarR family)
MDTGITAAQQNFIQGMSRISNFWGFPRAMGALFGAIYLSPNPLSLNELVELSGVTKGAVSTNVRQLERLGMVHQHIRIGDRKNYYTAETDFWKIIKGILREREKGEFDAALQTVDRSLEILPTDDLSSDEKELAEFYRDRMINMQAFFRKLDNLVAMILALDEFRLSAIQNLFGNSESQE